MNVVIRTDGGPEIGYGHLVRSGALAAELLSRGHTVTYATTTPEQAAEVCPDAADITELSSRTDPEPFVEWLDSTAADFVFTDAYPVDTEYQRTIRNRVPLAVLQDDARHAVCADVFVNGNLYAEQLDYDYVGSSPRKCLGPSYLLLRREVRELAKRNPPWREEPGRALVTMGGSDPANLTPEVLRAFDGLEVVVDVIVGPGYSEQQEQEIRGAAADISVEATVNRDPDDLYERMFTADFAVTTASTTVYELFALGTPSVSIPVVSNQQLIANALQDRDAATVLEEEPGQSTLQRAINRYNNDSELRQRRREYGRNIVDGQGTKRIVEIILNQDERNTK